MLLDDKLDVCWDKWVMDTIVSTQLSLNPELYKYIIHKLKYISNLECRFSKQINFQIYIQIFSSIH